MIPSPRLRPSIAARTAAPSAVIAAAAMAMAIAACDRAPLDGPPALRPGRDLCAECGMSVMEDRCSAAMLVERDDGRHHLLFDDIGCMLDHERNGGAGAIVSRFVHDYGRGGWIDATRAGYLMSESIRTPMDSWLVAFSEPEAAAAARAAHGGTILAWPELATVRKQWLVDRRPPTTSP